MKIGIIGNGFVGGHLANNLLLSQINFVIFSKEDFENDLFNSNDFHQCTHVFLLAGINRHQDDDFILNENLRIVEKFCNSLKKLKTKFPHIFFSSSVQEKSKSTYGIAKKKCRQYLEMKSSEIGFGLTSFIIPNVFGPFCKPYYNSVVSTFCFQISRKISTEIKIDKELSLIYIDDLIELFLKEINTPKTRTIKKFETHNIKVSDLLEKIKSFYSDYVDNNTFPKFNNNFEFKLFLTFYNYFDFKNYFPKKLLLNNDSRGIFAEIFKSNSKSQISFSTTKANIIRGNHFHKRKFERFCVIKGIASIKIKNIWSVEGEEIEFELNGNNPSYVDMPIWYSHNIKNVGKDELITIFWINEPFDKKNPDTYFKEI